MTIEDTVPAGLDSEERPTTEAMTKLKAQLKSSTDRLVGETKRAFADAKAAAGERMEQGRAYIEEKPYQALGVGLLAGVIIGYLLSGSRPQVIYLKDRRD